MGNVLEVTGLNKSYQDFSLTDVGFAVPEDCIVGFIGINGAGKTTTIRTMLGLTPRGSGTIRFFGEELSDNEQALKNRIGVVLDGDCFYDDLTMAEMKSIIAPVYTEWSDDDYKEYMDRFSLDPRQKISTLSKGMRMKFSLVLALSHQADLLIMDEPTSGLDPLIREQFLEIMTDYMKRGGKGALFSTHITSDLDKVADIIILINEGRVLFEKEKDGLLDDYRLVKGDANALNDENKKLFLNVQTTAFGFTGISDNFTEAQKYLPDILVERATIEDIMLAHIEGGRK
jgi:ABC-2 type transport system ATP-binding protein